MSPLARVVVAGVFLSTLLLRPVTATAQPIPHPCDALPRTVEVPESLGALVTELLRRSPTFRQQCAAIAAARHVRITVVITPPSELASSPRARARIERYQYGLIRAHIELPAGAHQVELLPHELEHVIEQIEGIDLAALRRAGDPRVVCVEKGSFETTRAIAVGRAVAAEVYGTTDPAIEAAFRGVSRMLRGISFRPSNGAKRGLRR